MATVENPPLITSLPLTAEAREELLMELFSDELPHQGELFVPGNSFYIHGSATVSAQHMVNALCEWLGVKPGYIGLEFETHPDTGSSGHRHTIFIESYVTRNEMLLGAVLAHAMTRYLLEERKQIHLADPHEQLSLAATATVVFGLGVVMANGLEPGRAHQPEHKELLGNLPISQYGAMLHGFLWQRAIPEHAYANNLAPWSSRLLGVPTGKRPIVAVRQQIHAQQQKKYQAVGLWWIVCVGLIIACFIAAQATSLNNKQARDLREKVRFYEHLVSICNESLAYTKQYSDLSDIQTERSVNAEQARCDSLENQRKSVHEAYKSAL